MQDKLQSLPKRFTFPSPGFSNYWNEGYGREMLQKLHRLPEPSDIENHARHLWEADPLGDEISADVFQKAGYHKAVNLVDTLLEKGIDAIENPPVALKKLWNEIQQRPHWLNDELLEAGSRFCQRSSVFGLLVLRNYCLMGGYESSAINKPLIYLHRRFKKGSRETNGRDH
jgi:hypothetical protein